MFNKITEYREKKGLTQEELAKAVKISRPYLSNLELGKQKPSVSVSLNIAKVLGEPVEAIFFDENVNHSEQSTA